MKRHSAPRTATGTPVDPQTRHGRAMADAPSAAPTTDKIRQKPRAPRKPTSTTRLRQERFLAVYPAAVWNISEACRRLGQDRSMVYEWLRDPAFVKRLEQVTRNELEEVRGAVFSRAKAYSDTAAIFLLRRLDPDFKDPPRERRPAVDKVPSFTPSLTGGRPTVTELGQTTVEGPALTSPGALSDGELAMLKQLLIKAGGKMPARLEHRST